MVAGIPSQFHWADYIVFAINLLVSAFIGIFIACVGKKKKDTKDFLVGGRNMKPIPVALSLLASFTSAPFIMGVPSELYSFGPMYQVIMIGQILACIVTAYTFVPIFHRLELTSAYEYLEARFSKSVRVLGSGVFSLKMTLYMAVVIYAPSMAFERVTGMPTWISILATGLVCTFYTAVGGMKAVVWADVVQMCIIIVSCVVLVVMGSLRAGGISEVFTSVYENDRLNFYNFNADPTDRHTFWSQTIGGMVVTLSVLASNQVTIQRYMSIEKLADARKCIWYSLFFLVISNALICLLGFVLYAVYGACDPFTTGKVRSRDQMVPMFVMDTLGHMHGLPGLFAAAVFSATLSTISSGLNALAAVILIDMIKPAYLAIKKKELNEDTSTKLSKGLAAGMGFVVVGLAYLAPLLGPTILIIAISVFAMVGGPLLGLFTLAIFFPACNWKGAICGLVGSMAFTGWIVFGAIFYPRAPVPLPVRLDGCPVEELGNITLANVSYIISTNSTPQTMISSVLDLSFLTTTQDPPPPEYQGLWLYTISYMWLATISVVTCTVIGMLISYLTGKQEKVDPALVFSFSDLRADLAEGWRSLINCICCNGLDDEAKNPDYEMHQPVYRPLYEYQESLVVQGNPYAQGSLVKQMPGGRFRENVDPGRRSVYWSGPEITWQETYISSL